MNSTAFHGKFKAVTFSYDDGVTQDIRLRELFDKYGLKATFNINSGLLGKENTLLREAHIVNHTKVAPQDVREIYAGHEIAAHTVTHPSLSRLTPEQIFHEVEDDRLRLSELAGYEVVGMAYPNGSHVVDDTVRRIVREQTGIRYARGTNSTYRFAPQEDLIDFSPTVYHHREWDAMFDLGRQFVELKADTPQIFYVFGHAYEFDIHNTWDRFEEFCRIISGRDDIFYGTNREVLLGE